MSGKLYLCFLPLRDALHADLKTKASLKSKRSEMTEEEQVRHYSQKCIRRASCAVTRKSFLMHYPQNGSCRADRSPEQAVCASKGRLTS